MKVFTFYYNRYKDATTSLALNQNGIAHKVLVHNTQQADEFIKNGTCKGELVVTDQPKGLAYQRNSALRMMATLEWAVFMCDDLQKIKSYPPEFITSKTQKIPITEKNQQIYTLTKRPEISLREMFGFFPRLIEMAERNNVHLVGFALHDNPRALRNKFTTRGLADGRFWLVKKASYEFDENVQLIDDVAWTAENLVRHKNVLVLNWCIPYFKRYTPGGFGSVEERIEQRRKEVQYLISKYQPLVRGATKPGWPNGTHLRINGSDKNIDLARKLRGFNL